MFQMLGVFAELEREMIRERVASGMDRVRDEIERTGRYTTTAGTTIKRLGRPNADPVKLRKARAALAEGHGIIKTAKLVGLGVGTVQKLKAEMPAPL
jgi:DNA invertase Pin-like site-specific DNA recombinase